MPNTQSSSTQDQNSNQASEVYSNTPLHPAEITQLSNGFLSFLPLFKLTIALLRRDFVRSWLKPLMWIIAIIAGIYAILILAILIVAASANSLGSVLIMNNDIGTGQIAFSIIAVLLGIGIFVGGIIGAIYLIYTLNVRMYLVLNNASYKSMWSLKDRKSIRATAWKYFLTILLISIITFIPGIFLTPITVGVSFIGLLNAEFFFIGQVINTLVSLIPTYIALSLFGYALYLTLLENVGPINSIKQGFGLVKPYYFKNIIRWIPLAVPSLLLSLILTPISALASLPQEQSAQYLSQISTNLSLNTAGQDINIVVLTSIVIVIAVLIFVIAWFGYAAVVYYFNYLSFLNLRLTSANTSKPLSQ